MRTKDSQSSCSWLRRPVSRPHMWDGGCVRGWHWEHAIGVWQTVTSYCCTARRPSCTISVSVIVWFHTLPSTVWQIKVMLTSASLTYYVLVIDTQATKSIHNTCSSVWPISALMSHTAAVTDAEAAEQIRKMLRYVFLKVSEKREDRGINKAIERHPLGTMNICTKCHANPFNSWWHISLLTTNVQSRKFSITKVIRIHLLGTMIVCPKCDRNSFHLSWVQLGWVSVWTKLVDELNDSIEPRCLIGSTFSLESCCTFLLFEHAETQKIDIMWV